MKGLRANPLGTALGGWAFVTAAMMAWMNKRGALMPEQTPWIWVGPLIVGLAYITLAVSIRARHHDNGPAAGGKLMKWGLLWLILFDASWLAAAHLWWQAGVAMGLAVAAWVTMTALRHLNTLTAPPSSFDREPQRPTSS